MMLNNDTPARFVMTTDVEIINTHIIIFFKYYNKILIDPSKFVLKMVQWLDQCNTSLFWKKLEKKYAPALDNYGQNCFVRSDFLKIKCVCKTQMMPPPDHKKEMKPNYLSLSNIWWKSKSCGHAHLHDVSSYNFRATALIFCRMFIHIMEVCMSTGFWFSSNILKMTGSWT
jgi:hypothetical protein